MAKARKRLPGEGSIYQDASTGRWVGAVDLGWIDGQRTRKRVTAKTAKEAQRKLRDLRKLLDAGVTPDADKVTGWIAHWLDDIAPHARKPMRPSTATEYRRCLDRYIRPTIGHFQLRKLTPDHIRGMHAWMLKRKLSTTTVRHAHSIVQRALSLAMAEGKIDRNVAQIVGAPSPARAHHAILSSAQAVAVIRSAAGDTRLRCRLICALVLGIRQGEALGLQWGDVLLGDGVGTVTIHETVQQIKGQGLVRGAPKTDSSRRTIPLPPLAATALAAWRAESGGKGYVFHGHGGHQVPEGPRRDHQAWKDALVAAEVPHVPLHGARGSAATLLQSLGVADRLIADILGHAKVTTSQAHYLRSDPDQLRQALTKLSDALDPPAVESG